MRKKIDKYSFAKEAIKHSIKQARKSGKNPLTGRKFTKKQSDELKKLLKEVK